VWLSQSEMLLAAGRPNSGPWLFLVIMAVAIGVLVSVVFFTSLAEKKRNAGFKQAAEQLGFDFSPTGDPAYLLSLAGLPLNSRGRGKKLTNLMRGNSRNMEVAIFDYRYTTGSGKSSTVWKQTVLGFRSEALALPDFTLAPKGMWSKVGALFGQHSIEFDTHPTFSSKYALRGGDIDAIRKVFTIPVLDFYEQNLGWNTEGSGNRLLLYKQQKRVPPTEIAAFLENGLQVLSLIRAGT
jgi:hypothetical protein